VGVGLITVLGLIATFISTAVVPGLFALAGAAAAAIPSVSGLATAVNILFAPLTLLVALILVVVGTIALLATNAGGLRDRWFNIWQGIVQATVNAARKLQNIFRGLKESVINAFRSIENFIIGSINAVIEQINNLLGKIPGVNKALDKLETKSKVDLERRELLGREELAERQVEVGSGEDMTGITGRIGEFKEQFSPPDPEDLKPDGEEIAQGMGGESAPQGIGEGMGKEMMKGGVSPEDVFPDSTGTGTTGGTSSAGKSVEELLGQSDASVSTGTDASGERVIELRNVPDIIDESALRDFVEQIIDESQRATVNSTGSGVQ